VVPACKRNVVACVFSSKFRKVVFGGGCREELLIFAGELQSALRGLGPVGEDTKVRTLVELRFDAEEANKLVVDQEQPTRRHD